MNQEDYYLDIAKRIFARKNLYAHRTSREWKEIPENHRYPVRLVRHSSQYPTPVVEPVLQSITDGVSRAICFGFLRAHEFPWKTRQQKVRDAAKQALISVWKPLWDSDSRKGEKPKCFPSTYPVGGY